MSKLSALYCEPGSFCIGVATLVMQDDPAGQLVLLLLSLGQATCDVTTS